MVRIGQRDDAAAVLARARDPQFHGFVPDDLSETALPVQGHHRGVVQRGDDVRVGPQAAFQIGPCVAWQHPDAVRVVAGQVGHQQVVGDAIDLHRVTAEPGHQISHRGTQRVHGNQVSMLHLNTLQVGRALRDRVLPRADQWASGAGAPAAQAW